MEPPLACRVEPAARPWWRDGRVWLLLVLTAVTLELGWMLKRECHDTPWETEPGYQWRKMCYSDVQALYGTRGSSDGTWPYVETFNEYPPLTGAFMHAMGELAGGKVAQEDVPEARKAYLAWSGGAFALLALATTVCLGELVGRDRRMLYWVLSPALALYAFYNWDLLAIAPAVGALLAFRKGHMGVAGALLGLGASAKLYPAFLAPALGLWILREDGGLRRRGWAFGVGFAAVWAAVHLPFFVLDAHGLVEAYSFQAERSPNFETPWYALGHLGREFGWPLLDQFDDKPVYEWGSLLPLLAAFGVSGWAAWTRRLDPIAAACIPVFAFLAFNKVFSIQYTLWAIPLMMLAPMGRVLKSLVVVADLAVFVTLSQYFWAWNHLQHGNTFTPAAFAALFRAGVYAACAVHLTQTARRAPAVPPTAPRPEATAA